MLFWFLHFSPSTSICFNRFVLRWHFLLFITIHYNNDKNLRFFSRFCLRFALFGQQGSKQSWNKWKKIFFFVRILFHSFFFEANEIKHFCIVWHLSKKQKYFVYTMIMKEFFTKRKRLLVYTNTRRQAHNHLYPCHCLCLHFYFPPFWLFVELINNCVLFRANKKNILVMNGKELVCPSHDIIQSLYFGKIYLWYFFFCSPAFFSFSWE